MESTGGGLNAENLQEFKRLYDQNYGQKATFHNNNLPRLHNQALNDIFMEESIIKCSCILHPHYNTQSTSCDNPLEREHTR